MIILMRASRSSRSYLYILIDQDAVIDKQYVSYFDDKGKRISIYHPLPSILCDPSSKDGLLSILDE